MKKLLLILSVAMLASCSDGNVEGYESGIGSIEAEKVEWDGKHFIMFTKPNAYEALGVTLDPDYLFQGDTIVYGGNKYVKIN